MKKKCVVAMLAVTMLTLAACGGEKDTIVQNSCTCSCEACQNCVNKTVEDTEEVGESVSSQMTMEVTSQEEQKTENSQDVNSQTAEDTLQQIQEQIKEQQSEEEKTLSQLTEGEKAARKTLQANLAQAREEIYAMPNSLQKTQKINAIDKQIIENNVFDFSEVTMQFFGDSITEGICGNLDEDGHFISYVNYVDEALGFGTCMNNSKAGRMFTDYGGWDMSLGFNMGAMYNNGADISVIFLGVNDFLAVKDGKRYGDIYATESSAGYIGGIRNTINQLKINYPNQQVFFVTMYNISREGASSHSDVTGTLTLADYMDDLRKMVTDNGYHLIELYDTGFMDCTDEATSSTYLADGLHPIDSGNRILGEHIAAELSLHYSQKY